MDNNKRKKGNNGPKTKKTKGKKKQNGSSDSSLSSLGSLPDERQVTRHFSDEFSHTPTDPSSSASTGGIHRRRAVPGSSSQHAAMLSEQRRERPVQRSQKSDSDLNTAMRTCPHCRKVFVNSWAVPKHVLRVHDQGDMFHCTKCAYKSPSKESLDEHERRVHRTCPHCGKVFVFLDRHLSNCSKRPSEK